jgi:hypothetical protein
MFQKPKPDKKRSPLKNRPLRLAGQSLDEEVKRLLEEEAYPYITVIMVAWTLAGLEIYEFYTASPPAPGQYILAAVAATGFSIYQILRIIRKTRAMALGRDGERAVGQYLERFREQGFQVFHDVVGEHFNIDHVLIGDKGIFAIETKTFSKPAQGKSTIRFVDGQLQANGRTIDRNPIEQACAGSIPLWRCV